jgi:hypothetical protein
MAGPTLVIEDGTASTPSANSYVTVDEVVTFCVQYGLSSWASLATTDMITSILRGMAFVESEFNFKGVKMSYDDPLEWPRFGIYDEAGVDPSQDLLYYEEIPKGLKNAVCRAAYEESVVPGVLQANVTSNIRRERIDVIETEFFGTQPSKVIYRTIQGFLKGLIANTNTANVKRT